MKFTADFSTRNGYGNQICIANNIENLIITLVNRGFNFVDGMQNEIVEWSKTTNKKYYRTGITIERGDPEMTEYTSLWIKSFKVRIGDKIMDELRTTPHDFIWRVKNPQDYWADTLKEVKYDVYLNGKRRGGFIGVNRTFDDDTYYVNYYDENNNIAYCTAYTDTEIILKQVNRKE